jgi:hypothetical protein
VTFIFTEVVVTVGCIPITDGQIDELYILAAQAKNAGQDFIPVHIFPIRYNVKRSADFLNKLSKDDPSLKQFALRLEDAFDYFEKYRQLPVVMTNERGDYLVDGITRKPIAEERQRLAHKPLPHRTRVISNLADVVHQWPEFPTGGTSFSDLSAATWQRNGCLFAGIHAEGFCTGGVYY